MGAKRSRKIPSVVVPTQPHSTGGRPFEFRARGGCVGGGGLNQVDPYHRALPRSIFFSSFSFILFHFHYSCLALLSCCEERVSFCTWRQNREYSSVAHSLPPSSSLRSPFQASTPRSSEVERSLRNLHVTSSLHAGFARPQTQCSKTASSVRPDRSGRLYSLQNGK